MSFARVLLVDDYQPNILVATTYLEMLNIDCDTAKDGLEALEMIANDTCGLVLLDVQMPVMDVRIEGPTCASLRVLA